MVIEHPEEWWVYCMRNNEKIIQSYLYCCILKKIHVRIKSYCNDPYWDEEGSYGIWRRCRGYLSTKQQQFAKPTVSPYTRVRLSATWLLLFDHLYPRSPPCF